MLQKLADAGMNLVRLNLSHGDHASHGEVIRRVHAMNANRNHPVAIMVDTQGPEIRTGDLAHDMNLHDGDEISLGNIRIRILHTPGHTPEHISFMVTDGAASTLARNGTRLPQRPTRPPSPCRSCRRHPTRPRRR